MGTPQAVRRRPHLPLAGLVAGFLLVAVILQLTAAAAATPPAGPTITALTPTPGSKSFVGETLTIAVEATGADPTGLEYQFLVDAVVIQPWSPASACQWVITDKERGLHTVTAHVRDAHGQATATTDIYVVRHPVPPPW